MSGRGSPSAALRRLNAAMGLLQILSRVQSLHRLMLLMLVGIRSAFHTLIELGEKLLHGGTRQLGLAAGALLVRRLRSCCFLGRLLAIRSEEIFLGGRGRAHAESGHVVRL